jgi:hypothetical protein
MPGSGWTAKTKLEIAIKIINIMFFIAPSFKFFS